MIHGDGELFVADPAGFHRFTAPDAICTIEGLNSGSPTISPCPGYKLEILPDGRAKVVPDTDTPIILEEVAG